MRTIFLIALLFIGSFQILHATTQNPLLAYSVSYEQAPYSIQKQKKKRLKKKRKQVKLRVKPEQEKTEGGKARKSLILGGIFTVIFIGLGVGAAVLFSGGIGFGAILLGVPILLIAIVALALLITFFVKSYKLAKKRAAPSEKKTEEALRSEVPYLPESKQNKYIELRNQLTAVNINKDNFYRNLRARQKAGVKIKDLAKELNAIHKELRVLKMAIKNL